MKFVSDRELSKRPRYVRRLALEDEIVLIADGKPFAMFLAIEEGELEETIQLIRQVKGQRALTRLRQQAAAKGLDRMSARQIEKQIRKVRANRKTR
jgi:hypothetical protein